MRVVGVGDNTIDKYIHLGQMFPGGNALNVAVLTRRLGYPASYIGRYGRDEYGQFLAEVLQAEDVDISHCQQVNGQTAYGEVYLVDGDRVFGPSQHGVSSELTLSESDLSFIAEHQLTHTSVYSHLEPYLPQLRDASPKLSFDFSQGWEPEYLAEVLPWVDIAILSYPQKTQAETEELVRWIAGYGPEVVLVTQGENGATVYNGRQIFRQGIIETQVVDTLGAGDAFIARFLVEYLGGTPLEATLALAAQSAALTCGYYGAFGHGRPFEVKTP